MLVETISTTVLTECFTSNAYYFFDTSSEKSISATHIIIVPILSAGHEKGLR